MGIKYQIYIKKKEISSSILLAVRTFGNVLFCALTRSVGVSFNPEKKMRRIQYILIFCLSERPLRVTRPSAGSTQRVSTLPE